MPRIGPRYDKYLITEPMSTRTAPFGTQETPLTRIRIIGGKPVRIPEETDFGSPYGSPRTGQYGVAQGPHQIIPNQQQKGFQGIAQQQQQQPPVNHPNFNQSQSQQAYDPLYLQQEQHFKQLQSQELNQLYKGTKKGQEPWQQQQIREQQWQQQQHLQMHQLAQAQQPSNAENNHNRSRSQEWNSHSVLPPIVSRDTVLDQNTSASDKRTGDNVQKPQVPKYQHAGPDFPTEYPIDQLLKYLPRDSYLPKEPLRFSKEEELYLRRLVLQGLKDFNNKKLKDLYMDLTGYDKHLTGFVEYHDLSLLLSKYQAFISTQQLRLIASMYVEAQYPGLANYEKVLSFIDSSMKERASAGSISNRCDGCQTNRSVTDVSPVTHAPIGKTSTKPPPFSNHVEDSKLFRLIQQQLLDSETHINFETVWQEFRQADRQQRNTLSRDQIKSLSIKCRIPLQESVLDQIIDRCDSNHGQYIWRQYLEFLEKVYPAKTGLKIPESKKPLEFAKHYPEPSSDWPRVPLKMQDMEIDDPVLREPSPQKQLEVLTGRIDKIQNGRAGLLPGDVGKTDTEPAGIPNGLAQIKSGQQREQQIMELETLLHKLEAEHEETRAKVLEERKAQKHQEHSLSWIDRFLKLGKALYANDPKNTGYVSYYETKWLAHEYNRSWRLDINEADIDAAIKWSLEGEKVNIDAFLKRLVNMEPN